MIDIIIVIISFWFFFFVNKHEPVDKRRSMTSIVVAFRESWRAEKSERSLGHEPVLKVASPPAVAGSSRTGPRTQRASGRKAERPARGMILPRRQDSHEH